MVYLHIFSSFAENPALHLTVESFLSPLESFLSPLESFLSPLESFLSPLESFLSPFESFLSPFESFLSPLESFLSPLESFLPPLESFLSPLESFLVIVDPSMNKERASTTYILLRRTTEGAGKGNTEGCRGLPTPTSSTDKKNKPVDATTHQGYPTATQYAQNQEFPERVRREGKRWKNKMANHHWFNQVEDTRTLESKAIRKSHGMRKTGIHQLCNPALRRRS